MGSDLLDQFLMKKEWHRKAWKDGHKQKMGNEELANIEVLVKDAIQQASGLLISYAIDIRKEHEHILQNYAFFSEVIESFCPVLFSDEVETALQTTRVNIRPN
jgi:hypothetical protein